MDENDNQLKKVMNLDEVEYDDEEDEDLAYSTRKDYVVVKRVPEVNVVTN